MIMSVTGHRPDRLFKSDPYSKKNQAGLTTFAVECLKNLKPDTVLTGMALGWDTAIAQACVELDIPFEAILPCVGQDSRWPPSSQSTYKGLLSKASKIHLVFDGTFDENRKCMTERNIHLVDNSDHLLALWDGDESGGTAHCYRYARSKDRQIKNGWKRWIQWREDL